MSGGSLPKGHSGGKRLKKIHVVMMVFGVSVVAFSVFVYVFSYAGLCAITSCETTVEITSYEPPEWVYVGDKFSADFIIKNTGSVKAENCILHWRPGSMNMSYDFSESFSLLPSQEISFTLETHRGSGDASGVYGSGKTASSTAWVVCDNTESAKVSQDIDRVWPP